MNKIMKRTVGFVIVLLLIMVFGLSSCTFIIPCQHTDGDGDRACDKCGEAVEIDDPNHVHEFDQKVAEKKYLMNAGDCNHAAKYYYSCSCGKKGDKTFSHGNPVHKFDQKEIKDKYFAAAASCESGAT